MSQPFPDHYKEFADGMGIGLYQVFSFEDASSVLGCSQENLNEWAESGRIECICLPASETQFFGYQLIGCLIKHATAQPFLNKQADTIERIIRVDEVLNMVGFSRSSLWRYEREGKFPSRVRLGEKSVGWKLSEVQEWVDRR